MALKHATAPVQPEVQPEPAINVAPEEAAQATEAVETQPKSTTSPKVRHAWTDDKVRAVKAAIKENPGIDFEVLLINLRDGYLADMLTGVPGRVRLLNLIRGIRNAEAKQKAENAALTAAGKTEGIVEFTPMPDVVMPVSQARPNLLGW